VTVAAGHTVIFNVDQSGFATGLAGLTINGTLKIPSQAEDPSMPNMVVLKVNANIAGSGSFIIGSPTQPITYPQSAKIMVNGTITVANFNAYGEQRSPLWDYLAQDAPAGATTIVLQNGLPLRAGDLIAIGRSDIVGYWYESSTARGLHTVASYNAATKTVTLNEALTHARSGTGVRACLVILLSRQIVISKYGANNVTLLSGSGRTIQGVLFQSESGATVHSATTATSSSFTYSSHIGFSGGTGAYHTVSGITLDNYTGYSSGGYASIRDPSGTNQLTNSAFVNAQFGIFWFTTTSSTWTLNNIHLQNCPAFLTSGFGPITYMLQQCTCKNANLLIFHQASTVVYTLTISNITLVDGSLIAIFENSTSAEVILNASNIQMHGYLANSYFVTNQTLGAVVIKNLTGIHNVSGQRITLAGRRTGNVVFINCSLSGYGNTLGDNGAAGCKYINCSLANAFNPIIQNHLSGVSEIVNLSTNAYYRPTLRNPSVADQLWTNRIIVKGLTVAGTQHPKAFEHLFPHGYVKNRWDAATPDYTTFDFRLTQSSFTGQPIWLEYQVFTADPIRVTGTITQLGTNESVKVQIFSAGKEPLYGDTPDFEQSYTATGDIAVNWTPTDKRAWIVRILAYLRQTTTPITIANLQVAGGGAEGDGGGQTYNVNVSDSVTPTLSDSATLTHSLSLSDGITATLSDQATLSAPISLSDSLSPTLSDSASAQIDASATDNIAPTLSDSGAISAEISTSDNIAPTLQDSANLTHNLAVSDSLAPTLSESAQASAQISATDSIAPTLNENVSAGNVYEVGISDQITPTLSDSSIVTGQITAAESITPTLSESVTAGNIYEIGVSDQVTPTLSDSGAITGQVNATENITPTLQDSGGAQVQITQTEAISPTIQEAPSVSATLSVSDAIAPTLQDSGQVSAQVAATETIAPTLQENVAAGNVYNVGVSDGVTATLSETVSEQADIAATDSVAPTLAEDALAGNIYDISVADNVSPTLTENITEQATINAQETINATLTEQVATTPQVSVSEDISPTLQESISASSTLTISEQVIPTLQEATSTTAQVSATETLNPTLQDSSGTQAQITQTDTIAPTLQEALSTSTTLSVSDTIAPALQDTVGAQVGVSASETITPTLQEQASVFSGGTVLVVEPLEISLKEDELQLELDED
jgi:hypothetical protein